MNVLKENYCCCSTFSIHKGVFLIALHSFFQATFGVFFVITTYYKKNATYLYMFVLASLISLFPTGILVFGASLFSNYTAHRVAAAIFSLDTFLNYCASFVYILWFNDFSANSALDKILFWRNENDWVGDRDAPFCLWHIMAYCLMMSFHIWWYYSFQLWRFAKFTKLLHDLEKQALEAEASR